MRSGDGKEKVAAPPFFVAAGMHNSGQCAEFLTAAKVLSARIPEGLLSGSKYSTYWTFPDHRSRFLRQAACFLSSGGMAEIR
jgi:hypothetical protein